MESTAAVMADVQAKLNELLGGSKEGDKEVLLTRIEEVLANQAEEAEKAFLRGLAENRESEILSASQEFAIWQAEEYARATDKESARTVGRVLWSKVHDAAGSAVRLPLDVVGVLP